MYYVFAYDTYYPHGGARDLVFWNEDLYQCLQYASEAVKHDNNYDTADVYGTDDVVGLLREGSYTR